MSIAYVESEEKHYSGSQGAFITEYTLGENFRRPERKMTRFTPIKISIASVYNPNIVSQLEELVEERLARMNVDSPRTRHSMEKLGITVDQCIMQISEYDDFKKDAKDPNIQKLRYIHHLSQLISTYDLIIEDRRKSIRSTMKTRTMILNSSEPATSPTQSTQTNKLQTFNTLSPTEAMQRINEKHAKLIRVESENFAKRIEEGILYQTKMENFKMKHQIAQKLRSNHNQRTIDKINEKRQRYEESIEKAHQTYSSILSNNQEKKKEFKRIQEEKERLVNELKMKKEADLEKQRLKREEMEKVAKSKIELAQAIEDENINKIISYIEEKDYVHESNIEREREMKRQKHLLQSHKWNSTVRHAHSQSVAKENRLIENIVSTEVKNNKKMQKLKDLLENKIKSKHDKEQRLLDQFEKNLADLKDDRDSKVQAFKETVQEEEERLRSFSENQKKSREEKIIYQSFRMEKTKLNNLKLATDHDRLCNARLKKDIDWKTTWEEKKSQLEIAKALAYQNSLNLNLQKEQISNKLTDIAKRFTSKSGMGRSSTSFALKIDESANDGNETTSRHTVKAREGIKNNFFSPVNLNKEHIGHEIEEFMSQSNIHFRRANFSTPKLRNSERFFGTPASNV